MYVYLKRRQRVIFRFLIRTGPVSARLSSSNNHLETLFKCVASRPPHAS